MHLVKVGSTAWPGARCCTPAEPMRTLQGSMGRLSGKGSQQT